MKMPPPRLNDYSSPPGLLEIALMHLGKVLHRNLQTANSLATSKTPHVGV